MKYMKFLIYGLSLIIFLFGIGFASKSYAQLLNCNDPCSPGGVNSSCSTNYCYTGFCRNQNCVNVTTGTCGCSGNTVNITEQGTGSNGPIAINSGDSVSFQWTATSSSDISCTLVADPPNAQWSEPVPRNSSRTITNITVTTYFYIRCNQSGVDFIQVNVNPSSNLACGQTCSGDAQCTSGHCYTGVCRNPSCSSEPTCVCSTNTPTPTSPSGIVNGTIYIDSNNDGTCSELTPYAGGDATLQLRDRNNPGAPVITRTPNASGQYSF